MTDDERKRFGADVRAAREALGWSQKQLALSARVSQSDVSEIENGRGNLTFEKMQRVAKALGGTLRVSIS